MLGRAWVAPAGTKDEHGDDNNYSADSRVRCYVHLTALSAADGQPVDPSLTKIHADLPNWLRYVMYSAGASNELSKLLPRVSRSMSPSLSDPVAAPRSMWKAPSPAISNARRGGPDPPRSGDRLAVLPEVRKQHATVRASALKAMPGWVQMLLDGAIHPDDFEVEVMRQHVSTAVSQQEADEHRRQGYPPAPPPPKARNSSLPPPPPPSM